MHTIWLMQSHVRCWAAINCSKFSNSLKSPKGRFPEISSLSKLMWVCDTALSYSCLSWDNTIFSHVQSFIVKVCVWRELRIWTRPVQIFFILNFLWDHFKDFYLYEIFTGLFWYKIFSKTFPVPIFFKIGSNTIQSTRKIDTKTQIKRAGDQSQS